MNPLRKSIAVIGLLGVLAYGCRPEAVRPAQDMDEDSPRISGAVVEHPALDTICNYSDTLFLVREEDGSTVINKCYQLGNPIPCPTGQLPWGSLVMVQGYFQGSNYIDCNFTMAPGWYCDRDNWKFGAADDFDFDNNGVPIVDQDWGLQLVSPAENRWQLRIYRSTLPRPCFDVALRVNALKLNLFGFVVQGSQTITWGQNRNWNNPQSGAASTSPFLLRFCPTDCIESNECTNLELDLPGSSPCKTLTANASGISGASYSWSTGETSSAISVCPTTPTVYNVSISNSDDEIVRIIHYTVNTQSIYCGNGPRLQEKVWVCHIPPGNPGNPQEICIDWNGVPAHVAAYRSPQSNPNLGHDSGCHIGRCGSLPCIQ